MKQLLIVGIDPGTTTAYAALNLDGEMVQFDSSKQLDLSILISEIMNCGKALIVGCDKANAPSFVYKYATKTGSRLINPKKDLLVADKKKLVNTFCTTHSITLKNDHERDALASALYAQKEVRKHLNKIKTFIAENNIQNANKIYSLVIQNNISPQLAWEIAKKDREPIARISHRILKEEKDTDTRHERGEELTKLYDLIKRQDRMIAHLKKQNVRLTNEIKVHKKEAQKVDTKLKIALKKHVRKSEHIVERHKKTSEEAQQKVKNKVKEIKTASNAIKKHEHILLNMHKGHLLKKLKTLGTREFAHKKKKLAITQNDILYIEDPTQFSLATLRELKGIVSYLICEKKPPQEVVRHFQCIMAQSMKITHSGDFALISKKAFDDKKKPKELLERVVQEYKDKRRK